MMFTKSIQVLACSAILVVPYMVEAKINEKAKHDAKHEDTEVWTPVPKRITPSSVPSDALVLFNGQGLKQWVNKKGSSARWPIKNGELLASKTDKMIYTKDKFCDMQMHVEWRLPKVDNKRKGQQRGNSGIKIQGRYEVQILDSNTSSTYVNGQAASIYKQSAPLVNVTLEPQIWQSYDIFYKSPTFDDKGDVATKGYLTLLHNGVLVQNNFELQGNTAFIGQPKYTAHGCEPLGLQFHGSNVGFRNIWVRKL